jgi:hypothetical protein
MSDIVHYFCTKTNITKALFTTENTEYTEKDKDFLLLKTKNKSQKHIYHETRETHEKRLR